MRSISLVDDEDEAWLRRWRWSDDKGYAHRVVTKDGQRTRIVMSRLIMGLEPGDPREVDHKDGNTYDNRRKNLRIVSHHHNGQNRHQRPRSSPHRGVSWNARRRKWVAQARWDGRNRFLGYFDSEEEAAEVARKAREQHQVGALD